MANKTFTWDSPTTLISYDLTHNDVSASEIANASNGQLHTYVGFNGDNHQYSLPNTTLWYHGSKEQARDVFLRAFSAAKNRYSSCSVNILLIAEVGGKSTSIED